MCIVFTVSDLTQAVLPRYRRKPTRYDERDTQRRYASVEEYLRHIYFEVIDMCKGCIQERFDQSGMITNIKLENLVLNASCGRPFLEDYDSIVSLYTNEFDKDLLLFDLESLTNSSSPLSNTQMFFDWALKHKHLYPELFKVAKLLLLMPASNASSERSFSAMGRLKTSLRAGMGQARLNSLLLLHVHKTFTDQLDKDEVVNEFVKCHTRRAANIAVQSQNA